MPHDGHLSQLSVTGADTSRLSLPASTPALRQFAGTRPSCAASSSTARAAQQGCPQTPRGCPHQQRHHHDRLGKTAPQRTVSVPPARAPVTGRVLAGRSPRLPPPCLRAARPRGPCPRARPRCAAATGGPAPARAHNRLLGNAPCALRPSLASCSLRRLLLASPRSLRRFPWPTCCPPAFPRSAGVPRAVGPCRRPRGRARSGAGASKAAAMGRVRPRRCATRPRPRRAGCC